MPASRLTFGVQPRTYAAAIAVCSCRVDIFYTGADVEALTAALFTRCAPDVARLTLR
jgi:hypothetical protein